MKKIFELTKDLNLPDTDIILEKGDIIEILNEIIK